MKYSQMFVPTMREDPKEAEIMSHKLMLRAGFIRRLASGIYTWLPLGLKSLRKLERIIREEMERAGAQEVLLPFVQPKELWEESKRWDKYGKELLRFRDRNEREMCLGPTHEEVITDLVRREVRSYRELPLILYQIQIKFRDEIRPRFGVIRAREFIMKDAYSFDVDEESSEKSYAKMYDAYERIFRRCGLKFKVVEAETGPIGGSFSHEFMVLAETGEDIILFCEHCGYAANLEKAEVGSREMPVSSKKGVFRKVSTPDLRTVEEVSNFLRVPPERLVKTLIYSTEKGPVGVLLRGDRELNEIKLKNLLSTEEIELADEETIEKITGGPKGFSGPIGISIPLYADLDLIHMEDFVTGGNEKDMHLLDVNLNDFNVKGFYDLKFAKEGDPCPKCGRMLFSQKGIEVGHIFKLGLKYSEAMDAKYLDRNGRERFVFMGCYGIGVGRTIAAAIEQNYDDNGMKLPLPISPFEVMVLPVNFSHKEVRELSEGVYQKLIERGVDCIIDDRDERPGVKFKDCDLIGIPIRVTLGEKNIKEGFAEIKFRSNGITQKVRKEDVVERTVEYVELFRSGKTF